MAAMFISLGSNCYISKTLRKTGFQKESYPFDWINTFSFREEVRFIKEFHVNPNILENIACSKLKVDTDQNLKSYYFEEYKIRLPHEHEIKKDITIKEIVEKYERRYKRLIDNCKNSDHIIFIRTIAYKCYDVQGESDKDYNENLVLELINFISLICGHDRFTLLIISNNDSLKNLTIKNTLVFNMEVPFENTDFVANKDVPFGNEAIDVFKIALENFSQTRNTEELKNSVTYPFSR